MLKELLIACNFITLLLTPFSISHPLTNNISTLDIDLDYHFEDVTFRPTKYTISGTDRITIPQHNETENHYYMYCTDTTSNGYCKLYHVASTTGGVGITTVIPKQDITDVVNETLSFSEGDFTATQVVDFNAAFKDGKPKTGYFTLSGIDSYYGATSTNGNAAYVNGKVYFHDTSTISLQFRRTSTGWGSGSLASGSSAHSGWSASNLTIVDTSGDDFEYDYNEILQEINDSIDDVNSNISGFAYSTNDYLQKQILQLNDYSRASAINFFSQWLVYPQIISNDNVYFINGTAPADRSEVGNKATIRISGNSDLYFAFMYRNDQYINTANIKFYNSAGDQTSKIQIKSLADTNVGGDRYRLFLFHNTITENLIVTPIFEQLSGKVIPILPVYIGNGSLLSDQEKEIIGIASSETQPAINNNDATTNALNDAISNENQIASTFESSFNNAQSNIDTSNPVIGISNFANSANWVRVQFERFTTDNAFGTILGFSLLLGLALAIIGRVL